MDLALEDSVCHAVFDEADTNQIILEESIEQLEDSSELADGLVLESYDLSSIITMLEHEILNPLVDSFQIVFYEEVGELLGQMRGLQM